jgi:hypothetical protein
MPYPIDEVRLPKVTRQNIIEIGPSGVLSIPAGVRYSVLDLRSSADPGGVPVVAAVLLCRM